LAIVGAAATMDAMLRQLDVADGVAEPAIVRASLIAPAPKTILVKPTDVRTFTSVAKVEDVFASKGYSLDAVRRGLVDVPRVRLASLPRDLPQIQLAQDRKALFLRFMLPYVLEANDRVRDQRERMLELRSKVENGIPLSVKETESLNALFEEYRVKPGEFATLTQRLDTVPPSLALAQAAVESGWGTSRFAQQGNAPFGQWTSKDFAGLVPKNREEGLTHKIRAFDHLTQSVESYLRNLNTHRAYRDFRRKRAALRNQGKAIDSLAIAGGLSAYSEKGAAYVSLLRRIIVSNNLRALDNARLGDSVAVFHPDV
jgi:Bax protein